MPRTARSASSGERSTRSITGISSSRARCGRRLPLAALRLVPAGDSAASRAAGRVGGAPPRDGRARRADYPGLEVDDREITRPGRSYTVMTLEELRAEAPARPLALIVGADALAGLPQWHRWREIFELAHIVVVARPGVRVRGCVARRSSRANGSGAIRGDRRRAVDATRRRDHRPADHRASDFGVRDSRGARARTPKAPPPWPVCFRPRFWPILNAINSTDHAPDAP